jgi:hypothetical protein
MTEARFSPWLRLGARLLCFLLVFELLLPLQVFGLSQSFLHYPADGETQASENFVSIFLVIVPALAAVSFFIPGLVTTALKLAPKTQRTLGVGFTASVLSLTAIVLFAELLPAEILLAVSLEALLVFGAVGAWRRRVDREPGERSKG